MKKTYITTLLFAGAVFITAGSLYAGPPRPYHDRDGIDTAARIVDLVTSVIRPVPVVVVQPAPVVIEQVPAVTRTVYTVSPGVTVQTVYQFPGTVYTETIYAPAPPRYYYAPRYPDRGPRPLPNRGPNRGPDRFPDRGPRR
jgi:hypothetical protein